MSSTLTLNSTSQILELPERPSPDGEEGETSTEETEQIQEDDEIDNWEDWDAQEETSTLNAPSTMENISESNFQSILLESKTLSTTFENIPSFVTTAKKKSLPDINELDIKNQRGQNSDLENFDFFQDMEPVIESTTKFFISENNVQNDVKSIDLGVKCDDGHEDGWGDEDW